MSSICKIVCIYLFFISGMFKSMSGVLATRFENRNWLRDFTKDKIESEVVNKIEEYPFQVMIHATDQIGDTRSVCGGAILNNSFVLTAAHCYHGEKYNYLVYAASITPFHMDVESENVFKIKNYIVHDNYDPVFMTSDIALIEVDGSFWNNEPSGAVNKAKLCTCKTPKESEIIVLGWGGSGKDASEDYQVELYHSTLTRSLDRKCMLNLERSMKGRFCGFGKKDSGICKNSSGSPAVFNGKLVGIVSMGDKKSCTFTDVWYYRNWILKNYQPGHFLCLRILLLNFLILICVSYYYPL